MKKAVQGDASPGGGGGGGSQVGIEADGPSACCAQVHFGRGVRIIHRKVDVEQEAASGVWSSIRTCDQPLHLMRSPKCPYIGARAGFRLAQNTAGSQSIHAVEPTCFCTPWGPHCTFLRPIVQYIQRALVLCTSQQSTAEASELAQCYPACQLHAIMSDDAAARC